jgi:hypothetical protein
MGSNVFPSMGKLYSHWVYRMAIDGIEHANIARWGEAQLGVQLCREDV